MGADSPPDGKNLNVSRILARASAAKAPDYPKWPSSSTGGVIPMSLVGRFANERERLGPDFNNAERQWRVKWIKDQNLHPEEPMSNNHIRALRNPIRRFYNTPLNWVEHNLLAPRLVSF